MTIFWLLSASTVISLATKVSKPSAVTVRMYVPTGRLGSRYSPVFEVVTVRLMPLSGSAATTEALAITAPEGSVTDPRMLPVFCAWPSARPVPSNATATSNIAPATRRTAATARRPFTV